MTRIPPFIRALGVGGLVPFVLLAGALWLPLSLPQLVVVRTLLNTYAALILSFVGALHWGLALKDCPAGQEPDGLALLWGVVPCMLAWLALMLPPLATGLMLAGGFLLQLAMDWHRLARLGAPAWFLRLRIGLTAAVVSCLLGAAAAGAV